MSKLQIDLGAVVESHDYVDLSPRDIFRPVEYMDDGPFMVINERGQENYKAVNLQTGDMSIFSADDLVVPINVKLVNASDGY